MAKFIKVKIMDSEPVKLAKGKTLLEISKDYPQDFSNPILLASVNNSLVELNRTVNEDSTIRFLDITDPNGFRTYQRSLVFLMVYAAKLVLGKKVRIVVQHSINKNYYCEVADEKIKLTDKTLHEIESKMQELVDQDLPIEKYSLRIEEAQRHAQAYGLSDKLKILKYRITGNVNFYKLQDFYDYFYGQMVLSTGYLKVFKLHKSGDGFILQFPSAKNPDELSELKSLKKVSAVFQEANQWAQILRVDTVGSLNDATSAGRLNELMLISEALHEKKIAYIADKAFQEKKSIVLIAGPSSSGKTTFAERLCVQLKVNGLKPYVLSLDNYFKGREYAPLDANGNPDLDSFSFMNVEQLNTDLKLLLKGQEIELPTYNFHAGKQEYKGKKLKLAKGDVLVLEGIHALNEELTYSIPKNKKFKIFISALTQLNIDDHNRIPTTDTRLIRRIVRDYQFRGVSAASTISQWPSVLNGEVENIFPYQEEADAFFNSALIYELSVLKQFVEPLLFKIDPSMEQYTEARRLIKFLDSFLGMNSEHIPPNSILREFTGGGCFRT